MCVNACPFDVPHVSEESHKSQKCTGCYDRVEAGKLPACASACPTGAIKYGPKDEMYALAEERVAELKGKGMQHANHYGTDKLGGLHSIFVLPCKLDIYDLPADPKTGDLRPLQEEGRRAFAAWQADNPETFATLQGGQTAKAALLFGGVAAVGFKRLMERKAEVAAAEGKKA